MGKAYFVSGIDTGIGKTAVTAPSMVPTTNTFTPTSGPCSSDTTPSMRVWAWT